MKISLQACMPPASAQVLYPAASHPGIYPSVTACCCASWAPQLAPVGSICSSLFLFPALVIENNFGALAVILVQAGSYLHT